MAYRKVRRNFRKKRAKKRTMRKRAKFPRQITYNQNYMNVMLRTADTIFSNLNNAENYVSYRFNLSSCLNYAKYVDMWDQFKINKVVITWKPIRTQVVVAQNEDTTPGTFTNIPSVVFARDHDDLTPVSYQDTKTRYGSVEKLATKGHAMKVIPAVLNEIYQGPVSTAYAPKFGVWIDTANASVPHYGVRVAMEAAEPAGSYTLECKTKIYLSFKNRVI